MTGTRALAPLDLGSDDTGYWDDLEADDAYRAAEADPDAWLAYDGQADAWPYLHELRDGSDQPVLFDSVTAPAEALP